MKTVNQRRRPVKRCRRGRNHGSSFHGQSSLYFNGLTAQTNLNKFSKGKIQSNSYMGFVIFGCFGILLVWLSTSGVDLNFEASASAGVCCAPRLTTAAQNLLTGYLCKSEHSVVRKRDISRMIARDKRRSNYNSMQSKKIRALKAQLQRLKNISDGTTVESNNSVVKLDQSTSSSSQKTNNKITKNNIISINRNFVDNDQMKKVESLLTLTTETQEDASLQKSQDIESGRLLRVCLDGKSSFRSFTRILKGLSNQQLYSGRYCPSTNTMINWAIRAGLAKLKSVEPSTEPCIDIMDHWIGIGNLKLFAATRITNKACNKAYKSKNGLTAKNFTLIHLEIVRNSTGEKVCSSLEKIYSKIGKPTGIISDGGGDLNRGIKLFNNNSGSAEICRIEDVSHRMACIVKKHYSKLSWFQNFTKNVGKGHVKLMNSQFAYLKSPKQNTKARFMNISKIINWSAIALDRLSDTKTETAEQQKFKDAYGSLEEHKFRISHMKKTLDVINDLMAILKTEGFSEKTRQKSLDLLEVLSKTNKVKVAVEKWVFDQNQIYSKLLKKGWEGPMPITSDPIESLFSRYKTLQSAAPQGDPTRLVAILPLLVGADSAQQLKHFICSCSHKEANEWIKNNVPETIHAQKRKFGLVKTEKQGTKSGYTPKTLGRPYEQAYAA